MSDKQAAGRGLLALRLSLDDETLNEIVTGALKYRKQAPQSLRKRFDNLLKTRIGGAVDGFRDATRAPDFKLIEPLLWLVNRSGAVFATVLETWAISQPAVRAQMAEHLTKCGLSLAADPQPIEMKAEWSASEVDRVLDEFLEHHPDVSRQIALALACYLTNQSPVDTEEEALLIMDSPLAAPHLSAWLKELQALPASDPSWSEMDAFIAAVQEIAESKRQEIQSRAAVHTAIEEFQKTYAGLIEYFGYANLATFQVDEVPDERLSDCKKAIDDLAESFRKRQSIFEERCPTYAADRDRYNRLFAEDKRIGELYSVLNSLIGQSGPEPGGPAREHEDTLTEAEPYDTRAAEHATPVAIESPEEPSERESASATATAPLTVWAPDSEPVAAENRAPTTAAAVAGVAGTEVAIVLVVPEPPTLPQERQQNTIIASPDVNGAVVSTGDDVPAQITEETPPAAENHPTETEWAAALESQAAEVHVPELAEGDALLLRLIEADDLSLAYWLASSRSARGEDPVIPHSLIGMLIGARLIESSEDPIIEEMRGLVTEYALTEASHPVLEIAAALRPAVLAPTLEVRTWTRIPSGLPTVRKLAEALLVFSESNLAFSRQDVTGAIEQSAAQLKLADARRTLEEWLQNAPRRDMGYQPASEVWHELCGAKGELQILARSAFESTTTGTVLRDRVDQWKKLAYVNKQVDRLSSKRIDGSNRQALLRNIKDAADMLETWCDAAENAVASTAQSDWPREQLAALRRQISDLIGPLQSELTRAVTDASPGPARAELHCLLNSFSNLTELVGLDHEKPEALLSAASGLQRCQDLRSTIAHQLVSYYELDLESDGGPMDLQEVEPALLASGSKTRTPAQVIEGWIRREDYRFIPQILERASEREGAALRQRFEASIRNSRAQLVDRLSEIRRRVEQCYLDNVIDENRRTDCEAELFGIKPESAIAFEPYYGKIQKVSAALNQAETEKAVHLGQDWEAIHSRLKILHGTDAPLSQIAGFIESQLDVKNIRVVQEKLSQIRDVLDHRRKLEDVITAVSPRQDYLQEFLDSYGALESLLAGRPLRPGPSMDEREQEVVRAWAELRLAGPNIDETVHHLQTLLRFVGFSITGGSTFSVLHRAQGWLHVSATMSTSRALARPFWQFGSEATKFQIVCAWEERRGIDGVTKFLDEHGLLHSAVVVLYFGKLSRQQRRLKVEPDAPVAVLDELLLMFLLRESGDKLPAFLRCSLPFSSVNPYIDFGNIPPEMFYGRTEMVDELQRRRGSCLVYGGRQLGKSVLLREVCRRFDDASNDQYAWVQDAPKKGKPTTQIWRDLLARHQAKNLLSDKLSTGKPEEIHKYILEMLSNAGDRQVLVLLDEADDFLEADADDSFAQVKSLRELMVQTDSRFRIVFAGIHHVQKFQGIPNQPLAQFGSPICVGPLEPGPASDLVVEPLDAIGVRFSDNSLPLLVLSYTNYHTGLIQSFCKELLRHVSSRRPTAGPPYEIGRSDIEAVYHRGAKLPDLLRERFDLTIRVDERYRAITWAMVEKQIKQRDSYSLSFSREEIGFMAAYWWPQVFKYTSEEELRGLLIEMVGLGILSRTNEGRYRLRSPNLIPMLGSEADITDSLLNLESKPAPSAFNADSYHIILSDNENGFSPLSFAQERQLNQPEFGIALLFASPASGISRIRSGLESFIPPELLPEKGSFLDLPSSINNADDIQAWLAETLPDLEERERVIVHCAAGGKQNEMLARINATAAFVRTRRARKRYIRFLHVFGPSATKTWASLNRDVRLAIEDQASTVVVARRWNTLGIRQMLAEKDKLNTDAVCERIFCRTNGWHCLIEEVVRSCGAHHDPTLAADRLGLMLGDIKGSYGRDFLAGFAFDQYKEAEIVLRFIAREGPVPKDLVIEMQAGESLSGAQVENALTYLSCMDCIDVSDKGYTIEQVLRGVVS